MRSRSPLGFEAEQEDKEALQSGEGYLEGKTLMVHKVSRKMMEMGYNV